MPSITKLTAVARDTGIGAHSVIFNSISGYELLHALINDAIVTLQSKYFIEPNIPKYKLDLDWVKEIQSSIPMLPYERKEKYISEYGLSNYDAGVLVKEKAISDRQILQDLHSRCPQLYGNGAFLLSHIGTYHQTNSASPSNGVS